jgi:hypothetical protein
LGTQRRFHLRRAALRYAARSCGERGIPFRRGLLRGGRWDGWLDLDAGHAAALAGQLGLARMSFQAGPRPQGGARGR